MPIKKTFPSEGTVSSIIKYPVIQDPTTGLEYPSLIFRQTKPETTTLTVDYQLLNSVEGYVLEVISNFLYGSISNWIDFYDINKVREHPSRFRNGEKINVPINPVSVGQTEIALPTKRFQGQGND